MRADYFGAWVGLAAHVALWETETETPTRACSRQTKQRDLHAV